MEAHLVCWDNRRMKANLETFWLKTTPGRPAPIEKLQYGHCNNIDKFECFTSHGAKTNPLYAHGD